jgi:hypothetical protein
MKSFRLSFVAACLTLLTTIAVAAVLPPSFVLKQVLVVHRHGARSPLVSVNESGVCPKYGCGVLNWAGKSMLFHLGIYLRENYNETLQPYDYYDFRTFRSRSTDVGRTLQSATSMISGLFMHLLDTEDRAVAVVSTKPLDQATKLLVWEGWPSIVVWQLINSAGFFQYLNKLTLTILSNETLQQIGEAQGLALECTPNTPGFNPFNCALDAQDVMNCARSSGDPIPSVVEQNAAQLTQVLSWYNSYSMWGYDSAVNDGKFVEKMGTYGYLLAKDIIARARTSDAVLEHYSGHDTTLMPLWMTLGNYTLVNPAFAAAMIFEAYVDNASNGTLFIVAKFGNPGQLPDDHSYEFEPFTLSCISSTGELYNTSAGCLLDDFERFVDTRGPSTPEGICYVPAEWLPLFDCLPNSTTYASNPACIAYRQACLGACGPQGSMAANYSCVV